MSEDFNAGVRAAHWAWSLGLAHRHIASEPGGRITYSVTQKGLDALKSHAPQEPRP